jgi:hypothetical protein
MKTSEIKPGVIYRNRGKGRTMRRVIAIGDEYRPSRFLSMNEPPDEPGVLYSDMKGRQERLYLSSFASWAGSIATNKEKA